jgi:DMSO/TMAO reductase YedYZ molybdopterin-dependent catalytic subunit
MSEAALDRLLAALIAAILLTGVLTWRAGAPDTWWLYAVHGLLSGVLLAASAVKLRRSLPRALAKRRWRQLLIAAPLGVATLAALLIGFAWVAGGRYVEIGPWTLLGWHGIVAWAVLGLALLHLLMRGRWRLLDPRSLAARLRLQRARTSAVHPSGPRLLSRRSVVVAGSLALVGALVWGAAELLDRLGAAPRRFTGSRWLPAGGIPPPTTFLGEGTPQIDPAAWRLRVVGAVDRPLELTLDDLRALGTADFTAVLDCTGGWVMETTWHGVPMARLLYAAGVRPDARSVDVKSVTGWGALLPIAEARGTLLAVGVAGTELPLANGAPCRLVVPNRRGLDWVKWVAEVRLLE